MKKITATMVIAIAAGVALASVAVMGTFNENDFTKAEFKAQAGDLANPSTFGLLDLKGHVTLVVRDGFGNIKDYREFDNTIFNNGRECLSDLISNTNPAGCTAPGIFNRISVSDCDGGGGGGTNVDCPVYAATDASPNLDNFEATAPLGDATLTDATTVWDATNLRIEVDQTFSLSTPTLESPVKASGLYEAGNEILAAQSFAPVTLTGTDTLQITWRIGL